MEVDRELAEQRQRCPRALELRDEASALLWGDAERNWTPQERSEIEGYFALLGNSVADMWEITPDSWAFVRDRLDAIKAAEAARFRQAQERANGE